MCRIDYRIWFKIYSLLEFLCLCYYFMILMPQLKRFFKILLALFGLLYLFTVWLWVYRGDAQTDSLLCILETVLVYAGSISWFRGLFTNPDEIALLNNADFYFVSGFILYFSGTLFLFLMTDFVFTQQQAGSNWYINILLGLLLNVILSIGAWKTKTA